MGLDTGMMVTITSWRPKIDRFYAQGNVVIERRVIYTFHARWANDFYKDRVILGAVTFAFHIIALRALPDRGGLN